MTKILKSQISWVLIIALVISTCVFPIIEGIKTAHAAEVEEENSIEMPKDDSSDTELQGSPVSLDSLLDENGYLSDEGLSMLKFLPSDPEKYINHIEKDNELMAMELYTDPIKFENEQGEYELIDNSIVAIETTEDSQTTEDIETKEDIETEEENEEVDYKYKNAASDIEILMSDTLEQSSAIEMSFENYSIGFKPLNIIGLGDQSEKNLGFVASKKNEGKMVGVNETVDEVIDESKKYDSIVYPDTFNEYVDIQITPTSTGIKEDIILYEIPKETEFSYEFTVKNAIPVLRKDRNLYFVDTQKGYIVAAIAAPYMYDTSEEYSESYDISVKLEKVNENTYTYTLIPDRKFLEDEGTAYPVIIDPSVNTTSSIVADTFTTSRYSGNNYVNDANLKIGYGSDLRISRGLVRITQFPFGSGYTITNAKFYAYQNYSGSSSPTIQLASITSNWNASTVTWSNQPGLGSVYSQQTVQAMQWYNWDITNLVKGWHTGTIPNYGMYVKSSDESSNKYKRFYSSNSSTSPSYFYIEYHDTTVPTTPSVSTSPNASSSWTNDNTLTLSWSGITDSGGSGLNRVEYKIDSGSWQTTGSSASSGSKAITLSSSGTHTLYVRGVDNAGNAGSAGSKVYKLDISAPNHPC